MKLNKLLLLSVGTLGLCIGGISQSQGAGILTELRTSSMMRRLPFVAVQSQPFKQSSIWAPIRYASTSKKTMNLSIEQTRAKTRLTSRLETLLLQPSVQAKKKKYIQLFNNKDYKGVIQGLLDNHIPSTMINEDKVFSGKAKTLEETTEVEALGLNAILDLLKEEGLAESIKRTLEYAAPTLSGYKKLTLQDPLDPTSKLDRASVRIEGSVISAEDILQLLEDKMKMSTDTVTGSLYEVGVYATHAFIMDQDIVLPGVNVAILSPKWIIDGSKTINLSGRKAKDPDPKPTEYGIDGKAGHPGESSGNLMIYGLSKDDYSNLIVKLNGGPGGKGQDAGDGRPGKRGVAAKPKNITSEDTLFQAVSKPSYLNRVSTKKTYVKRGKKGEDGRNPGKPGAPGKSGKCGVFIHNQQQGTNLIVEEKKEENGISGLEGTPGEGGDEGYRAVYYTRRWQAPSTEYSEEYLHHPTKDEKTCEELKKIFDSLGPRQKGNPGNKVSDLSSNRVEDPFSISDKKTLTPPFIHVSAFSKALKDATIPSSHLHNTLDLILDMARTAAFYAPNSFDDIPDIIHHLVSNEIQEDSPKLVLQKWQSFAEGIKLFIDSQKDDTTKEKAQPILRAIQHKVDYLTRPTYESVDKENSYVWNLESFVYFLKQKMSSLGENKRNVYFSQQVSEYSTQFNQEIQKAEQDSTRLYSVLEEAIEKIDKEITKIQEAIEDFISETNSSEDKIKKQFDFCLLFFEARMLLSGLQFVVLPIASIAYPGLEKMSEILNIGINMMESLVEVKVPEGFSKDNFACDEEIDIKEILEKLKLSKTQETFESTKKEYQNLLKSKSSTYPLQVFQFLFGDLSESNNIKNLRFEARDEEIDDLESKSKEKFKKYHGMKRVVTAVHTAFKYYNSYLAGHGEITKMTATKDSLKKKLKELKEISTELEERRKNMKLLGPELKDEISSYCNTSTTALISSYTTFTNKFKRLSEQLKEMQDKLQINTDVCKEIETVRTMFGGIVAIYKHVTDRKPLKKLAENISDLHKKQDPDLSKVIIALETHYLATQYFKIMDTLKHYTIALGVPPSFWETTLQFKFKTLQVDSIPFAKELSDQIDSIPFAKELSEVFTEVLTKLKKKLSENNVFIMKQNELVKHDVDYTTKTSWTHKEFPDLLKPLLSGKPFNLELDSELLLCDLDLFMFKDVALKITYSDSNSDSGKKINAALQKFLSMNAEAVLKRSGQSKFRIGKSVYILPISNPPTLAHHMGKGKQGNLSPNCNQVLGKLRSKRASPVLSPFGGTWSIKLKFQNRNKPIELSPEGNLKKIVDITEDNFLKGLKVELRFKGQCLDFAIDLENATTHQKTMQDILMPLQTTIARNAP